MPDTDPEVRLRVLTPEDADWLVHLDRAGDGLVRPFGWDIEKLAAEIAEGVWAAEEQVGWAVVVDGEPAGAAFARHLGSGDGELDIRLAEHVRGRGVGREVLRQLADHHFADHPGLRRLVGRTHENNVPMQRAFTAAGFRLEARYRGTFAEDDGTFTSEWGYALTREDWQAGFHRADDQGFDLHGLTFVLDATEGTDTMARGSVAKFLQEGRRVIAKYSGEEVTDGEAAGILLGDSFHYRFVHRYRDHDVVTGWGRSRVQRRGDRRLEIIDEWETDRDGTGRHVWVERT